LISSSLDAREYILIDLQKHGNIIPLQGDVTSKLELSAIVNKITDEQGFINVLIANSGITGPMLDGMPKDPTISQFRDFLWETDSTKFTDTFNVNVTSVFFSLVAFLELLDAGNKKGNVEQKSQIITVSSVAGFNRQPIAGYAYSSTKAGATHMMKNFATGLVPYDIRSNVIAPGSTLSRLY
jgi:NAD(P)-dependent dehydrogenase (short-subunit alcohol dehydrogenase family)